MSDLVIRDVQKKIFIGERRRNHLKRQLTTPRKGGTKAAEDFIRAEISAWDAALLALKHYQVEFSPGTSPYTALTELVDAVDELESLAIGTTTEHLLLHKAQMKARMVLEMIR